MSKHMNCFFATVLATWLVSVYAADETDASLPHKYSIKEDQPATGTMIRKDLVRWILPLNLRYSELSPEQRQLFKSQYEAMKDGDEPPFPLNGLAPWLRNLSAIQNRLLVEGPLQLDVLVDEHGNAESVAVLKSPSNEMTQAAATLLMLEKYKPALCSGTPCKMSFPVRITLTTK